MVSGTVLPFHVNVIGGRFPKCSELQQTVRDRTKIVALETVSIRTGPAPLSKMEEAAAVLLLVLDKNEEVEAISLQIKDFTAHLTNAS